MLDSSVIYSITQLVGVNGLIQFEFFSMYCYNMVCLVEYFMCLGHVSDTYESLVGSI